MKKMSGNLAKVLVISLATVLPLITSSTALSAVCSAPDIQAAIPDVAVTNLASGFNQPVFLTHEPDNTDHVYIIEQPGRVQQLSFKKKSGKIFLDIRNKVSSGGEKGLLSLAFHPEYKNNGLFYVNYTRSSLLRLETVIAEYKRGSDGLADPGSERVVLTIKQPYGNHNGGQINFGPDGFLYIGMGDGGAGNDPINAGQDNTTLLGAMLRIDVDKKDNGREYAIPDDNPFIGKSGTRPEIWAYGLRNPWRFSFDAANGMLFVADVGQNAIEEIDVIQKGGNYGWRVMEGNICTPGIDEDCNKDDSFIAPIDTYSHDEGRSVTGGYVYRGKDIPDLCGVYLYADYVSRALWGIRTDGKTLGSKRKLMTLPGNPSSFGEDADREIYILDHRGGKLLRLIPAK